METGMIISVTVLALLGLAFAVPNYLAIRYALLGGGAVAGTAPGAAVSAPAARTRKRRPVGTGAFMWKALSPFVFAVSVILGIALGDVAGIALVGAALLNLIWGMRGWRDYQPGKR
jgi:hypothetical protein